MNNAAHGIVRTVGIEVAQDVWACEACGEEECWSSQNEYWLQTVPPVAVLVEYMCNDAIKRFCATNKEFERYVL